MLLSGWLTEPDCPLAQLPMLGDAERRQLLVAWNDTRSEFPRDACIHHLIETQAERTPDAIALSFEGQQLTYRELDRRANQLAHYLRGLGIGPETLAAICVLDSLEMVIGILGILKAGGAYVPLDPSYPKARLAFMLDDSRAAVLLTLAPLLPEMPAHRARVVCLDTDWKTIARCPEERPTSETVPDNLAYVIYTSGSAGTPKGVMVSHRGMVNYLAWCVTNYAVEQARGAPVNSSIAFDLTITTLFAPLIAGRTVVLFRADHGLGVFTALCALSDFSLVKITPAHLEVLNGILSSENAPKFTRVLVIGGDTLRAANLDFWRTHAPETRLINEYGPTETVVGCCVYEVSAGTASSGTVPIGKPIANTQIYLLDSELEPVPIGVPGELYVGGAGLARGYLDNPALTAERFIASPFGDDPGARLYRTGDLARYRADGNIEFLGRIDHQVKIRGFRVELGEIEAVLCQYAGVREGVVLAREDGSGSKCLVAYLVSDQKSPPSAGELRTFLRQRLPEHMVPTDFVTLDSMPLTANGKVDRRVLETTGPVAPGPPQRTTLPRDSIEARLVEIWQSVLGVTSIGIRDDFFGVGGTSLLAVRMFARIEEAFGRALPLATVFQMPTVERLAQVLRDGERLAPRSSAVPIQPAGTRPPLFAVPGVGGDVVSYAELARRLGPDQPFYGLQSRGLDGGEPPLRAIETIAARYVADLRAIQPVGPYFLLGACMGGVVAFEMARQLRAAQQDVRFLALVDAWPTQPGRSWRRRLPVRRPVVLLRFLTGRLALHARAFAEHTGRARWRYAAEKLAALGRKVLRGRPLEGNRGEIEQAVVADANLEALRRYQPSRYDGRVTLFVAAARAVSPEEDQRLAWSALVGNGLEVHTLPSRDSGLMLREPEVGALAEHLDACLRKAQAVPPR
jgi:amino acid adenylation domain-containing protein